MPSEQPPPVRVVLTQRVVYHLQDCFAGGEHGFKPDPENCGLCADIQEAVDAATRESG